MNNASLIQGSASRWNTAHTRQRFYWVVLATCGVLAALLLAGMAKSHLRDAPASAPPSTATASADERAPDGASSQTPAPQQSATVAAPAATERQQEASDNSPPAERQAPPVTSDRTPPAEPVEIAQYEAVAESPASDEETSPESQPDPSILGPSTDEPAIASPIASENPRRVERGLIDQVLAALASPRQQSAAASPEPAARSEGAESDNAGDVLLRAAEGFIPVEANKTGAEDQPESSARDPQPARDEQSPQGAVYDRVDRALEFLFGAVAESSDAPDAASAVPAQGQAVDEAPANTGPGPNAPAGSPPPAQGAADGSTSAIDGVVQPSAVVGENVAEEVVLLNPHDSGGPVRYLVNGLTFSIQPGESQRLPAGRTWRIQFHRGDEFGEVDTVLAHGAYEFRVGERGWELATPAVDAGAK